MKEEEKNIHPILVVLLIVLLFGGYKFYESYKLNTNTVLKLQNELEEIKQDKTEEKETQITTTDEAQKTLIDESVSDTNNSQKTNLSISEIVKQWEDGVVLIDCKWYSSKDGSLLEEGYGSGYLFKSSNGLSFVNTNKHVVYADDKYIAQDCDIVLPKYNEIYNVSANYETMTMDSIASWGSFDFAQITIDKPTQIIKNVSKSPKTCMNTPDIGDELIVLGFPSIGSNRGVTVTEGIISGIEDYYYVTSAKIDSGNSGGAAVLVKDNCYLGMPTYANIGGTESLGRILDVNKVTKSYLGR